MRAFVFTDKALSKQAGRFVWLEMDTEKAENAALRQQLHIAALPTFFIVDPDSERVALRWVGGATVSQLLRILDDGRMAVQSGRASVSKAASPGGKQVASNPDELASGATAALARAERSYGAANYAAAAKGYEEVLALAPADWPRYGRTVESLLYAWQETDENERAATLAREAFPKLRQTPSAANVAASGLECALALPADNPVRSELVAALEADALAVVDDAQLVIAADDRSGVYGSLVDARKDAKDEPGAKEIAARRAAFLEGEAARAKTPDARAVFDSHRLGSYLELGQPERAVPMLQASERDLPDDYNPPARLAVAYKSMQRWEEALAASDRALAKAYGPRQLGILQTRAEIYVGRGDLASARSTLEHAVQLAEALPPGQRSDQAIAALRKKIDGLATASR